MWAILGLLYVIAFLTLAKEDWLTAQMRAEQDMARATLGQDRANAAIARAGTWYQHAFVDSGVQGNSFRLLVPTQQERQSRNLAPGAGEPLWNYVEQRLRVLWTVVYNATVRLSLASEWLALALVAALAFTVDGLVGRKIKQTNFDYTSPARHRYSVLALDAGLAVFLLALFLPTAINPILIPAFFLLLAAAARVFMANVQKKV